MKFSCGLTRAAKDYRKEMQLRADEQKASNWHRVFLWWPTAVASNGDRSVCAWLQFVERKYRLVYRERRLFYGVQVEVDFPDYRFIKED